MPHVFNFWEIVFLVLICSRGRSLGITGQTVERHQRLWCFIRAMRGLLDRLDKSFGGSLFTLLFGSGSFEMPLSRSFLANPPRPSTAFCPF